MSSVDPRTRSRAATLALWLVNLAVASVISRAYLDHAPERTGFVVSAFVAAALVSTLVLLTAPLALTFLACAGLFAESRAFAWIQATAWSTMLFLVYADTRIYAIFRYHFNGMVWNLMTTPGGEDAFELTPAELVWPLAAWATWLVVQVALLALFRGNERRVGARRVRPGWIAAAVLVPLVLVDKTMYARADLVRDRDITVFARVFPFYAPITVKKIARKWFGLKLEDLPKVELGAASRLLRYPLVAPTLDPAGARPNILVVMIDSLRSDALDPKRMPNLVHFAEGGRVFAEHASGGNATRFGVFSLVYGIPGSYWDPVYEENCPPVLVTELGRAGYDLRVISSVSMEYPEFRSTAWVSMEDRVEDQFKAKESWQCDAAVAKRIDAWLGERATSPSPFFAFVLLNTPHQRYSFDPADAPFQPYAIDLDYLAVAGDTDLNARELVRNRYWNAVHYSDRMLGELFATLERRGLASNTVVVVTGDHGEEFWENGYFGHTSNFSPAQAHVTFVMRGPGIPIGVEHRPTSHLDLAPTLLEMLGARVEDRANYSSGVNLLDPPTSRSRVIAGWKEVAIWVDGGAIYVPLEGYRGAAEAYGYDWKPLRDGDAFLAAHADATSALARECRRFLR